MTTSSSKLALRCPLELILVATIAALALAACGGNRAARDHVSATSREYETSIVNAFPSDRGPVPRVVARASVGAIESTTAKLVAPPAAGPPAATATSEPAAPPTGGALILYDDSGPYGWLGELYGIATANLASRFGPWTAKPVSHYQAGDIANHRATIYIASTYDQALSTTFLDEVDSSVRPVIWMYNNIWQLAGRVPDFAQRYGFLPWRYDTTAIGSVTYKGRTLGRNVGNGSGIMEHSPFDPARINVLASALRADGTSLPWAIRSGNLTYIGEIPFAYIDGEDRYLAFCDLLFDALEPAAAERHRALLRIEDVSAETDPVTMAQLGDLLISEGVPFSIALIPRYTDPLGVYNDGQALTVGWADRPELLQVLQSLVAQGATLILHGYTHQYGEVANPYSGASADDFEFFRAHIDPANYVIYDGAVVDDSAAWALDRVDSGLSELAASGLPAPSIFEYPHYAGSPRDSFALAHRFATAYHRGLYFGGGLSEATGAAAVADPARMLGQFFPYLVTDVFGWHVIPENIGNYEPEPANNHPARLVSDLLRTAETNLVVRDGVASFFFHPYYDVSVLRDLVHGIRALGYTFVAPGSL